MKRYQLSATLFKPNSSDCLSGVEGQFSGMTGGYGMMGGYGMGSGLIAVPDRLPTPSNAEWIQNLSEVLSLEKRSYVQYTTDEKKYNVGMPYTMVIPQEVNHIYSIEKLFSAYGLKSDGKPENPTETTNLTEAYQFGIQMERDLISRYSWLVQNTADKNSAQILNDISIQSNWHLQMFQMASQYG